MALVVLDRSQASELASPVGATSGILHTSDTAVAYVPVNFLRGMQCP